MDQGYINHVGIVLDRSSSMSGIHKQAMDVVAAQIQHLANRSSELDQETRLTLYFFDNDTECIAYDTDVLRLNQRIESVRKKYRPQFMTALIDATVLAINDLSKTATLYGDHAFLLYVITDGQENKSHRTAYELKNKLAELPDNWTVGVMVPDKDGEFEAKKFGFFPDNIAIWDTSAKGMLEVGKTIERVTDAYMTMRTQGVRSVRGIFTLDTQNLKKSVLQKKLISVPKNTYEIHGVRYPANISTFVSDKTGKPYKLGSTFYELMKTEEIQPQKDIAVWEKKTGILYTGADARGLLGLPAAYVKVRPADHPDFDIFVQSTSVNRKLIENQRVIVFS